MSNQFFDYIAERIRKFFSAESLHGGERYFLLLDEQEQVDLLYYSLKRLPLAHTFTYQHEESGAIYETFSLEFDTKQVVVAATNDYVTPDFLVTLRNRVGEQAGIWKNTILLILSDKELDSIQGGASNLQKEGMPLHIRSLIPSLKGEIAQRLHSIKDQRVVSFYLEQILQQGLYYQTTFLDFQDLFEILQQGYIGQEDFKKLGLFRDSQLENFTEDKAKDRLLINHDLFEEINRCHELEGDVKAALEKKFTEEGAKILSKDDWYMCNFGDVWRWHNENENQKKGGKLDFIKVSCKAVDVGTHLEVWEKPERDTKPGRRKRHILVFNPQCFDRLELKCEFELVGTKDRYLKQRFVSIGNDIAKVSGKNLYITLDSTTEKVVFRKVVYKHDNNILLSCELFIAVLPMRSNQLESLKTNFRVKTSSGGVIETKVNSGLIIGYGDELIGIDVKGKNETIILEDQKTIKITLDQGSELFDEKGRLRINLKTGENLIPLELIDDQPQTTPIDAFRIWKLKREKQRSFIADDQRKRLVFANNEYFFHQEDKRFFDWEFQWIQENMKSARVTMGKLEPISLNIDEDLENVYMEFLKYFKARDSIPSLTYIDEELEQLALKYVKTFLGLIEDIEEGEILTLQQRNLLHLGMIISDSERFITPFHPLIVAYQLSIKNELGSEEVDRHILERLKPDGLLPYIYDEHNILYRPDSQRRMPEWITYKPSSQVTVSDAEQFVARVVQDKISQFIDHFSYLFPRNSEAPLCINVINIVNDDEVLKGIINFIKKEIDTKGVNHIVPIDVTLYTNKSLESAFDLFARMNSVEQIKQKLSVDLKAKHLGEEEVLRVIQGKVRFSKLDLDNEYRYAHISFYRMKAKEQESKSLMNKMMTGLSLEGLVSTVPTMRGNEDYRTGFGIKFFDPGNRLLINLARGLNELACNMKDQGSSPYRKGETIVTRIPVTDELSLEKLYRNSHWVTFVNPNVDLDFFHSNERDLLIIHYSDQYTSSNRYDAVTVTDKTDQYFKLISNFLQSKSVPVEEGNIRDVVKVFNTFNGEWLLRIFGKKDQTPREKLSIISAIKHCLAYFYHPDILWVPISLEEILRVAGAVKLNQSQGIFSAKNLGLKGPYSDDLLLIGLECVDGKVKLHFYPVEVKTGINTAEVISKAKEQVQKTRQALDDKLIGEEDSSFHQRYYQNFFVQLLLANAKKILYNKIWEEKNYKIPPDIYEKLIKGDYVLSNELRPFIGMGAVLSFQKDNLFQSAMLEEDVLVLRLTEDDAFRGVVQPIEKLKNEIQKGEKDFDLKQLISSTYVSSSKSPLEFEVKCNVSKDVTVKESIEELDLNGQGQLSSNIQIEKVRVLLGTAQGSTKKVYWEYGHPELPNRHVLISGRSGQGKTYFIQCMLLELSRQGISSIVIDYTDGFKMSQLESLFCAKLGEKLKQVYVKHQGFPINPFRRNEQELDDGIWVLEEETDVAERVRSVFASVYRSLGIQQLNSLYQGTIKGLQKYGDKMDLHYLKKELENDRSNPAKTTLSQLIPLIDRNPFKNDTKLNWEDILNDKGCVYVIQLTGYPRDVQLLISEFILWDLWNFSLKKGNKRNTIPVVMDEAQNLDHSEKSPSARILTEGRKFGWSGWYATQFLKSQLQADELARLQNASLKVYFSPPESELGVLASSLSQDPYEKKEWERKLAQLKKGQCIVHGPILRSDGTLSRSTPIVLNITPLEERG